MGDVARICILGKYNAVKSHKNTSFSY